MRFLSSVAAPSDEQIKQLARAILGRERYRAYRPELGYDLLEWLRGALQTFLTFIADLYLNNPTLYWVLVVVLGVLCAGLLTHMVLALGAALRVAPEPPAAQGEQAELDFLEQAQQLAQRGAHLEAAHRLLLASLRTLAKGRHIPLHPEDGNGAVCRQLRGSRLPAALRDQLIELIVQTEYAWFGSAGETDDVAPALYRRWAVAHAELQRVEPT